MTSLYFYIKYKRVDFPLVYFCWVFSLHITKSLNSKIITLEILPKHVFRIVKLFVHEIKYVRYLPDELSLNFNHQFVKRETKCTEFISKKKKKETIIDDSIHSQNSAHNSCH